MPASEIKKPCLIAFDFDWTLIDEDSDRFIYKQLSEELLEKLYRLHCTVQWTDLMAQLQLDLKDRGIKAEQVLDTLRQIPFNPSVAQALSLAKRHGAEMIILSDANTLAIAEISKANGISEYFSRIITNPAHIDDEGVLRIQRLTAADGPQHNCPNGCAVNICKGQELMQFLEASGPYERVVYVGDGRNDLCPASKLRSTDFVLPRTGHALANILGSEGEDDDAPTDIDPIKKLPASSKRKVSAQIKFWKTGEDLYNVVEELFKTA
ncbi:hypothetical protein HDU85_007311 [Gaertneriomyces sp. JEL0708]|nr:hypothetical protein HDU85_007311 [Gaertneriomyces sp. JEL0708]